jgi:hypothetical protein
MAFEGETKLNGYTVPIFPPQLASDTKDCWVVAGNSPDVNPIKKVSLMVQQLGDLLVIVATCYPAPPTMKAQVDGVDVDGEMGGDGDVDVYGGAMVAINAGSEWTGKSLMETESVFL